MAHYCRRKFDSLHDVLCDVLRVIWYSTKASTAPMWWNRDYRSLSSWSFKIPNHRDFQLFAGDYLPDVKFSRESGETNALFLILSNNSGSAMRIKLQGEKPSDDDSDNEKCIDVSFINNWMINKTEVSVRTMHWKWLFPARTMPATLMTICSKVMWEWWAWRRRESTISIEIQGWYNQITFIMALVVTMYIREFSSSCSRIRWILYFTN